MPFIKSAGKMIYFAHVPKCGGTAVEKYLRARFGEVGFVDEAFNSVPASLRWSRSSPQHVPADVLERLIPISLFDGAFAVVRHPVERLISEFHFLRDLELQIDQNENFSSWLVRAEAAFKEDAWVYDNHLRPMTEIVPSGAVVFRLEEGLDQIVPYLDGLVGTCERPLGFERVLTRKPSVPKSVPSPEDIALIEYLYAPDFERFGYPLQGASQLHAQPGSETQNAK